MKKSFIERIFPHSPGDALPQYQYESPVPARSPPSPSRILLQDSAASSSTGSSRRTSQPLLSASLVRYDDPFLPVERAAKSLQRKLQSLLDAQSEGLLAGVGQDETNAGASSVGSSLTPTPSLAKRDVGAKTIPIRQPEGRKVTLREARRGLVKSMAEFARLKDWELTLIDHQVAAREDALKEASDLEHQRKVLRDEMEQINTKHEAASLRSEAQKVEQEIHQLETRLLELKARHRHLVSRAREIESSTDSRLSSYTESLRLNDSKVKSFLHHPPVGQSLSSASDPGMYALNPDRRTLRMAEEQWMSEVDVLNLRKLDVETEKRALQEGADLWQQVVLRVRAFEKGLRSQAKDLSRSAQLQKSSGGKALAGAEQSSPEAVLDRLVALITFLQDALAEAESKNWNLLICSIGAELAAFEQARDLLQETTDADNDGSSRLPGKETHVGDDEQEDAPHEDLLSGGDLVEANCTESTPSAGEGSNHSLEDTLREFGTGLERGKQDEDEGGSVFDAQRSGLDTLNDSLASRSGAGHDQTSESEDDDPGPEFLVSHT